jgi:hypothetical protein
MDVKQPWEPGETPDEQDARRQAYERLSSSARRVGLSLERLSDLLRQVTTNEAETRRFLSTQVYGVPDELLDDLLRVRMGDEERKKEAE